jgi:hypothetical protein
LTPQLKVQEVAVHVHVSVAGSHVGVWPLQAGTQAAA